MSEIWRRCRGVLKEGEGEEWGLPKAWWGGAREGGRSRGAGWVGPSHTQKRTRTIAPVHEKTRLHSLPPRLLRLIPLTVDLPKHKVVLSLLNRHFYNKCLNFQGLKYLAFDIIIHKRRPILNHCDEAIVYCCWGTYATDRSNCGNDEIQTFSRHDVVRDRFWSRSLLENDNKILGNFPHWL